MGKNWAGPFFPHPDKIKHQPCADGYLGGEKLGRPILSPPRLVKVSTLPCHEYANNLCFLGGGEELGPPILSLPWQDKALTLCRWLSGWRKTRLVHSFPTLTSESINLTLSWIHIQPLLFRGWGKTGPAHSFPTLTSESINLLQKLGYLGGEKLGRPILFPPWQDKASTLTCHENANNLCFLGGGEKLCRPILSPPSQDKASALCRWLSEWRKTRLVHSFPTLTSESINLTLSWIHIQPLLFRGWGKTGPSHFFPTLTSESINLVQKLGYLGGEKLGQPVLSPPWLMKVSTLPCHEYANNLWFSTRLILSLVRVGKEWASPVFPHPITSNFWFYAYSWKGKVSWVFPHPINHMHKSFSPSDNLLHKVDV